MSQADSSLQDISVTSSLATLRQNSLWIIGGAVVLSMCAWTICQFITTDFQAESRISLQPKIISPASANYETLEEQQLSLDGMKAQIEFLTSGELLNDVSENLNLTENTELNPNKRSIWARALVYLGLRSSSVDSTPNERALQNLRNGLHVYNVRGTRLIAVQYSSPNARTAAEVANAVADSYIAMENAQNNNDSDSMAAWLASEIADLHDKLGDTEKRLSDHQAANRPRSSQPDTDDIATKHSEVLAEISRLRAERSASEASADIVSQALASGNIAGNLPDGMAQGNMQRLIELRLGLNSEIASLSVTLLDGHPRIKSLRSQLVDLNMQINAEGRKLLTTLNGATQIAQTRENDLNRELDRLNAELAHARAPQLEVQALEREASAQRELLESYQKRYAELKALANPSAMAVVSVIFTRAEVPTKPYFPKILPVIIATFSLSLLLLAVSVILREMFKRRSRIIGVDENFVVAEEIKMPAIGAAGDIDSASALTISGHKNRRWTSPLMFQETIATKESLIDMSENPNSVKAVADGLIALKSKRIIAVSPEGDDASIVTVKFVRELADRGNRVILVDMTAIGTLGRAMLDGGNRSGITDLLAGERRFGDTIHTDHYSQAHIMPLGKVVPATAMRSAERLPHILDALETVYDFVVVECGPSTAQQIACIFDRSAIVIMNIVDPNDDRVITAAMDMDQSGYEDVIIVMDNLKRSPELKNGIPQTAA